MIGHLIPCDLFSFTPRHLILAATTSRTQIFYIFMHGIGALSIMYLDALIAFHKSDPKAAQPASTLGAVACAGRHNHLSTLPEIRCYNDDDPVDIGGSDEEEETRGESAPVDELPPPLQQLGGASEIEMLAAASAAAAGTVTSQAAGQLGNAAAAAATVTRAMDGKVCFLRLSRKYFGVGMRLSVLTYCLLHNYLGEKLFPLALCLPHSIYLSPLFLFLLLKT